MSMSTVMSTVMAPNKPMFSDYAEDMWASSRSSIRRPAVGLVDGAPRHSVVQVMMAFGGHGDAPGLLDLLVQMSAEYRALVGVEHVPAQRMEAFAFLSWRDSESIIRPR
jgi:hypothetical protein